ncbi:sigma-70 family RNA polymerase sigma factor [Bradyrhizobium genomosp. III]|uniref:RNA polymerase sigma factor n=1 Tax=Bradyrhizobium genomosp. III TaxID=2683271 RepID=UPI00057715F3
MPTTTEETTLEDIELVDRLLRGVPGAFDSFYRRHRRLIYHCIRARADAVDADDLLHSFFERLIERDFHILKLWQRGTSLPIYLSRVIRNFVVDFHRAKRSREKTREALAGLALIDSPPAKEGTSLGASVRDEDITSHLELKQLRRLGLQAWAELESRDRYLVCSKLHRDMSNEAMAERLSLSEGALRTALSRAQARLLSGLRLTAPEYFPTRV